MLIVIITTGVLSRELELVCWSEQKKMGGLESYWWGAKRAWPSCRSKALAVSICSARRSPPQLGVLAQLPAGVSSRLGGVALV